MFNLYSGWKSKYFLKEYQENEKILLVPLREFQWLEAIFA